MKLPKSMMFTLVAVTSLSLAGCSKSQLTKPTGTLSVTPEELSAISYDYANSVDFTMSLPDFEDVGEGSMFASYTTTSNATTYSVKTKNGEVSSFKMTLKGETKETIFNNPNLEDFIRTYTLVAQAAQPALVEDDESRDLFTNDFNEDMTTIASNEGSDWHSIKVYNTLLELEYVDGKGLTVAIIALDEEPFSLTVK